MTLLIKNGGYACDCPEQCRIQMFFGHTVFLKLRIGYFSDRQQPPMAVAECPKIFDV